MKQFGAALLLAGLIGGLAPNSWADSPPEWQTSWGGYDCCGLEAANGYFYSPSAVSVAPNGTVYVVDSQNDRVEYFGPDGTYLGKWGGLFNPHGIVAANDSTVFVCDSNNHRVMKFSGTGALLLTWGTPGTQGGEFSFPWGISTAGLGRLFVADNGNDRIQVFDFDGNYLYAWTGEGTAGELRCPTALLATSSGIFVCDNCNSRVVEFSRQGAFRSTWGSFGTGPGQFGSMEGITMDRNQTIYIADTGNGRVQKFKSDGTFLSQWNTAGPGQYLGGPTGLAIGVGSGVRLYLADSQEDVVNIYEYPVTAVPGNGGPGAGLRPLRAFPNPTAGGVELSFAVGNDRPEGALVRALVVDAAGHEVRDLAPGILSPGTHRIHWDGRDAEGRDVGAGVFFVKLVQDGRAAGGTRLVRIP